MTIVHAMSSNQQVKNCDKLKLVQTFFKYLRILASLLKKSQLAFESGLLASVNLHLSSTLAVMVATITFLPYMVSAKVGP